MDTIEKIILAIAISFSLYWVVQYRHQSRDVAIDSTRLANVSIVLTA